MPKDLLSLFPGLWEPRALEMPTAQSYDGASACFVSSFWVCVGLPGGGAGRLLLYSPKLLHLSCFGFLFAGVTGVPLFPAEFLLS